MKAAAITAAALLASCQQNHGPTRIEMIDQTRAAIAPQLLQLGARNWVVIADPTYPIPAGAGAYTMAVPSGSADTFREVLDLLELQAALTPRIWVCNEMNALTESLAPGITEYNREIEALLSGRFCYRLDERIISMQLADASQKYRILYIKTKTQLPYSTIAIELDSGYWDPDSEAEIRRRMEELAPKPENAETAPTATPRATAPTHAT
ncbi:MAG: hypothetical protein E7031_05320 [Akkermansiaceae bacterium]|nr:hypothetical protein [Akkermansiaceae bacterium]